MVAVIPWFFNGFSKGCRPYLLISKFARGGDMMIKNKVRRGTGVWLVGNEVLAAAQFSGYDKVI